MQKFGIDISRWQGTNFDISKAQKQDGVEFVIIKIGGADCGLYKDKEFENFYKKCNSCGMDKGVYFFAHAMNKTEAQKEADYIVSLVKNLKLEYPVWYDVEGDMLLKLDRRTRTDIVKIVMQTIEKAGFMPGIYSTSYVNDYYYADEIKKYAYWAAKYVKTKPTLTNGVTLGIWQFGGEQANYYRQKTVAGVVCDQDFCYVDFPKEIKAKGLNGYKKTSVSTTVKNTVSNVVNSITKKKYSKELPDLINSMYLSKYKIAINTKKEISRTQEYLKAAGYYLGKIDGINGIQTKAGITAFTRDVKYLQNFLKWYGAYSLDVDGVFGDTTEKAVKYFQKMENLTQDGIFGTKSLAKAKTVKK